MSDVSNEKPKITNEEILRRLAELHAMLTETYGKYSAEQINEASELVRSALTDGEIERLNRKDY